METTRTSHQKTFLSSAISIGLAGFLMLGLTGCPPPPAPPNPAGDTELTQLSSDAWRYDLSHQSEFPYGTMIYFNFRDDINDITAMFGYGVFRSDNPLFAADANYYSTSTMFVPNPAVTDSMRVWAPNDFNISNPPNSTTFNDGPGTYEYVSTFGYIDVLDDPATPAGSNLANTYHIGGEITDKDDPTKTISWDLTFERVEVPGWFPWEKWPLPDAVGIFPNSWIDYFVHMPVAKVNGTYTVDDGVGVPTVYDIVNAKGYHDGFHGEFLFTEVEWDWIDYKEWTQDPLPPGSEPDLDFWVMLLNQPGPYFVCADGWDPCNPGNLRAYYDGIPYDFYREEINVQRFGWTPDPDFGGQYPTEEIVTGENEDNYICIHWEVLPGRVEKSHWDLPDPLQDNVTYEFVANVEGSLIAKDPGGDCSSCEADCTAPCPACGTVLKDFGGIGWTDYVGPPFL
jgi:hypothetical protein